MLSHIQEHLQAIYQIEAPDVRPFLIDREAVHTVLGPNARPADEWVLARQDGENIDLAVYIAEEHIEILSNTPSPSQAVQHAFPSYCIATEGISHFLLLIDRARREEPISLLELEVQAEVDKYVTAWLHHPHQRRQLLRMLFHDASLSTALSPEERSRYREAGRLAAGYCAWLSQLPHPGAVLEAVRQFWRQSGHQRMAQARRMAA